MRFAILGLVGLWATQSAAAPGGRGCDRYEYKNVCPYCPYKPNYHHPRELEGGEGGLEERGDYYGGRNVCYKECPKEYQQCKYYYDDHDKEKRRSTRGRYIVDYNKDFECPRDFDFKLVVKIEEEGGEQRLNVYQNGFDNDKMKRQRQSQTTTTTTTTISTSSLGIYRSKTNSKYKPSDLNYNNYCRGGKCSVPVKSLPSYPDLCDIDIWIAVGNNLCYDRYGRNDNGYKDGTKYIQVRIRCDDRRNEKNNYGGYDGGHKGHEKKCREYCCCPPKHYFLE